MFMWVHVNLCVSEIVANITANGGARRNGHFSIPVRCIVPWFADTQCALIDRLVFSLQSVRICVSVCVCVHVNVL